MRNLEKFSVDRITFFEKNPFLDRIFSNATSNLFFETLFLSERGERTCSELLVGNGDYISGLGTCDDRV